MKDSLYFAKPIENTKFTIDFPFCFPDVKPSDSVVNISSSGLSPVNHDLLHLSSNEKCILDRPTDDTDFRNGIKLLLSRFSEVCRLPSRNENDKIPPLNMNKDIILQVKPLCCSKSMPTSNSVPFENKTEMENSYNSNSNETKGQDVVNPPLELDPIDYFSYFNPLSLRKQYPLISKMDSKSSRRLSISQQENSPLLNIPGATSTTAKETEDDYCLNRCLNNEKGLLFYPFDETKENLLFNSLRPPHLASLLPTKKDNSKTSPPNGNCSLKKEFEALKSSLQPWGLFIPHFS